MSVRPSETLVTFELSLPRDLLLVRTIMVKIFADSCQSAIWSPSNLIFFFIYFTNVTPVAAGKMEEAGSVMFKKSPEVTANI